jgi:hypothetical protein
MPVVKYVHLHTTLISTPTPALLPAYFKALNPPMPGTIITTNASGIEPEFNGLRYEDTIQRNGKTEYIVKIFSKAAISDSTLETWLGKGKLGWVYRKEVCLAAMLFEECEINLGCSGTHTLTFRPAPTFLR